ncbi:MAG: hypothetical protein ACD_11C00004G0035 [uncultured bacterium]|nr:MAG: hypothetical protein ACD_11C00004G0035 [uncultured bacterium]HBR71894.1 hypothetical protein [Candidatus Moranbacteria bacterium]
MSFDLKKTDKSLSDDKNHESEKDNLSGMENFRDIDSDNNYHSWEAPEFEVYEKSATWYFFVVILLGAIIFYAIITESLLMAITFILLGVVGYIHSQKKPRILEFVITSEGVRAGKEIYLYEDMESFWIFYDPPHTKTISLRIKSSMLPFVHIPIAEEDPAVLREKLLKFVPEKKQDPGLVDVLERILHI